MNMSGRLNLAFSNWGRIMERIRWKLISPKSFWGLSNITIQIQAVGVQVHAHAPRSGMSFSDCANPSAI